MADQLTDVLVAGYPDVERATKEFDDLVAAVKAKTIRIEGAILISHDKDDNVVVQQTGDHLGRKGLGYGGSVGFLVGLAAPPLLAATVVGAAAGGIAGRFAKHKMETGLHDKIGEALKPGTAAILAMFEDDQALAVQQVLAGALARSVVQTEKSGTAALKDSLAEAMGKFSQDRTVLPIPDRTFGGVSGRTMDASVGDWSMIPGPKPPEGAPNVLLVLIDDAGFGGPDTFGGELRTPNLTRVQQMGLTYNRFHVTAVCSPTRAALLTGRNHHRVGMGGIAEFPGPFPGYTGTRPRSCTALPRILKENGYITGGFGKWHMTPGREMGPSGPFEHWPQAWGFDHWWGFLTGAAGQYDPIITQDNSVLGVPEGKDGKLYYFPDDITDKSVEWLHAVRAHDPNKPWFLYYSTGATHAPHHVASEWADKYKGQFDDGWDAYRERTLERQKKLGIVPAGHRPGAAPRSVPRVGHPGRRREEAVRPPDGGVRRLLGEHRLERGPAARRRRGDGRARQHAGHLHLGRQRRLDGGDDHRLVQRDDVLQRPGPQRRGAAGADREVRRPRGPGRLPQRSPLRRGLGPRPEHALPVGQADGEPPGRRPRPDGHRLAGPHPGRRSGPQPVHPRHRRRADDPRPGRHPGAQGGGRDRAGADGRHPVQLHVRGPGRRGPAHGPVLRDVRQPRHLQGRLVGLRPAGQAALGLLAGDPGPVQAGQRLRPRPGPVGAVLPAGRLLPGARPRR